MAAPVTAILTGLAVPTTATTAAAGYSDPLQTGLAQYEALFCLPASFTPAAPVPANYTGEPPSYRRKGAAGSEICHGRRFTEGPSPCLVWRTLPRRALVGNLWVSNQPKLAGWPPL